MIGKLNLRQRAISDYEFGKNKNKAQFCLQVREGRFSVDVARIGVMYPYLKIFFGDEIWKSEPSSNGGMHPKWDQVHQFSYSSQKTLEIIAYDKSLIFGETEIGRCTIHLNDVVQGQLIHWWDLLTPSNSLAGHLLLTFEFPQAEAIVGHSSNNSWDLKMHHHVESSPVTTKFRYKHLIQFSNRTPDSKIMHCSTEPDEVCDLEHLRNILIEENDRLKNQEIKVRQFFDKLKEDSGKLREERIELRKSKEILQKREETILAIKAQIAAEKLEILKEKEDIQNMKSTLNSNYLALKQEKLKTKAYKRLQELKKIKVLKKSEKIEKHKQIIQQYITN
jgi:C2 domain